MKNKELIPIFSAAIIPFLILVFIWFVHLVGIKYQLDLSQYGIYPRKIEGLRGVFCSAFIHNSSNFKHIINNSLPVLILGWALFYFYKKIAWQILIYSWLVGGLFVWLAARQSYHIGISGIIYSLAFYLFFSGVFRKDVRLMAIALFVVFLYGSMIWGIFPYDWSISFESHFMGALVGIVLAFFFKEEGATFKRQKTTWEIEEELGIEPPDFENNFYNDID